MIEYNTWDVCIFQRKYYFEYVVSIIDIFSTLYDYSVGRF